MIDGVGVFPYPERLKIINTTALIERCSRGDPIEDFKIKIVSLI